MTAPPFFEYDIPVFNPLHESMEAISGEME